MASSDFGRMLSVGTIRFEDSKKGGIGGGGWVHPGVPCTWQLPWLARAVTGRRALTIESSLMSGCG